MHGRTKEMYTILWLENLKGRDHLEDLSIDGKTISDWILGKWYGKVWNDCIWLRTGTSSRLL